MKTMKNFKSASLLLMVILLSCCPVYAAVMTDLYIMSVGVGGTTIYNVNTVTGNLTTVSTTAMFASIAIASDSRYLYYWNSDNITQRGIARWDPLTDTHILINSTDLSEENACSSSDGRLWVLDRTNSYDPQLNGGSPGFLHDNTGQLYEIDKTTGARTVRYTLPDVGGYAVGDIDWGPDGMLYISTNNTFWGYDDVSNYVWDPETGNITKKGGVYHAGLIWLGDKLYASRMLGDGITSGIFELNPNNFSEIRQVVTMPTGVSIGDLADELFASGPITPEPATLSLLVLGTLGLVRRRKSQ
jgi:hypothetical protein